MTTTLYLVRHGESEANAKGVFAGQHDSPLTARGRAQAEAVAAALRHVVLDRIVSSDLSRTRDTAEVIARGRGIAVEPLRELREIDLGSAVGKSWDESRGIPGYDPERFTQWPGGESLEAVVARVMPVVDRLVTESAGKAIAIVGHGGVTRILVSAFMGVLPKLVRAVATNTNITVVTHDPARGYVVEEMFNDAHVMP